MKPLDPVHPVVGFDIGEKGGAVYNYFGNVYLSDSTEPEKVAEVFKSINPRIVYAEDVHAFKGQGIVSTGKLLRQKGELIGICAALSIRLEFISPETWIQCYTLKRRKNFLSSSGKLSPSKWKAHLHDIARPLVQGVLVNEISRDTADAFLIWNWAAHLEAGYPLPKLEEPKLQFK